MMQPPILCAQSGLPTGRRCFDLVLPQARVPAELQSNRRPAVTAVQRAAVPGPNPRHAWFTTLWLEGLKPC